MTEHIVRMHGKGRRMYVISYDISHDKLRNKVAKTLQDFGSRVQYSVFECNINETKYRELHSKLVLLMTDVEDGSIREYHLCSSCNAKTVVIGTGKKEQDVEGIFII